MNLGWLHVQRGELKEAEAEYAAARRLDPSFTPAAVNLADVYRTQERDADGERVLREALAEAPRDSHVHHALGLLLLRRSRLPEALEHLGQAAASDPANARHAYVYGLALRSAGRTTEAAGVLARALRRHPADRDLLLALADLERGRGR
jgi:Flp pilus assembly protein TadD